MNPARPPIHIALVHFPTVDKQGETAATSVTNLDIHDLSRTARTYGVDGYWIVHPYDAMQRYVQRVMDHWTEGWGAAYNPTRRESLAASAMAKDLEELQAKLEDLHPGREVCWVATSAKRTRRSLLYPEMRRWLADPDDNRVFCVLFGTGWGLHPSIMEEADFVLEPIDGPTDWNHLSVRAAAAIIIDRLMAPPWWSEAQAPAQA